MEPLELSHPDTDATTPTDSWLTRWHDYLIGQRYHFRAWQESHSLGRAPMTLLEAGLELEEISWERVKGGRAVFYQR